MDDWIISELEDDFDDLQRLISTAEVLENEGLARVFHRLRQMFADLDLSWEECPEEGEAHYGPAF